MIYITETDKLENSDFNKSIEGKTHDEIIEKCLIDIALSLRILKLKLGRKLI